MATDLTPGSNMLPARPEAIPFDAAKSALIVVDMQNAYASPEGYLDLAGFDISGTRDVIARVGEAVVAARTAEMPVIFLQNGWDPALKEAGGPGSPNWTKSNALKLMRKRPELAGKLLAKGGWDYALVDDLTPQDSDIVVPKVRYSGFHNTALNSILRARGITHIVLCGVATNVCVESTLRDGFHLEFFAVLLEDACHQAGPRALHDAAVYNTETFFGWVSSTADFTSHLATSAQGTAP